MASNTNMQELEENQILLEFAALTTGQRADFMEAHGLPKSLSKKSDLMARIQEELTKGSISIDQIVAHLDRVVPWGKQHVYLFDGPDISLKSWKKREWLEQHLKEEAPAFHLLLKKPASIGLPTQWAPASITLSEKPATLRVSLVRRREWWDAAPELNEQGVTAEGEAVEYRAFIKRFVRNFVAFEWNLDTNQAMLQISQLPREDLYESVRQEFESQVDPWLPARSFRIVPLRNAIRKLLEEEQKGKGKTRTQEYDLQSNLGRSVVARSIDPKVSVFGERTLDDFLVAFSKNGVQRGGNFFWLPSQGSPLDDELRVYLVGSKNRINFTSPSSEPVVRYVLGEIRHRC
jgi:hypothetical protein